MLVVTPAIGNLIRENKTFRITSAIQTGAKYGMILMDDSLFNLWREGKCSKEEVLMKAHIPAELGMRIAKAENGIFEDEGEAERRAERDGKDPASDDRAATERGPRKNSMARLRL